MNRQSWNFRLTGIFVALAASMSLAAVPALGQVPVDEHGNPLGSSADTGASGYTDAEQAQQAPILSDGELAELVGPVALYPDDLLAIVLPASTYPLEIVQAARFLEQQKQDSSLQPNEDWDESVTALLNYPEVLTMLNDDIDWTWKLGDAVVNQQADVIAAVESFRDRAYAAGNLKSDQYQTVTEDDGIIEIVPVLDDIIYVPYYEPEHVLVRQVRPVYYYYSRPYPVYYYPYPAGYSFYSGYFWGVTTAYRIGWLSDHLHVHHHSYWGHPYFGHSYYGHYYRRPSVQVYNTWYVNNSTYHSSNRYRDGDYWRPRTSSRARPPYYTSHTRSYRDDDVSRRSSVRNQGNAYATQVSANRPDRVATSGTRQRTEQTSSRNSARDSARNAARDPAREVRSDTIRFRERSDTRQTVREQPAQTTARASTVTRQPIRSQPAQTTTRSSTETRRTGTSAPVNSGNSNRESSRSRATVVRAATSARSDTAAVRRVEAGTSNPVRTEARAEPRQQSRTESRSESRGDSSKVSRTEARTESRAESRSVQASARQGNERRRERN